MKEKYETFKFVGEDKLTITERGNKGFGPTGF